MPNVETIQIAITGATALLGMLAGWFFKSCELRLQSRAQTTTAINDQVNAAIEGYRKLCADLQARVSALESRQKEYESRIEALEAENDTLKTQLLLLQREKEEHAKHTRPTPRPTRS